MLGMSMSLLKTRRHLVVKGADPTWLAARLQKLAAYCGHTTLRTRCAQTAPLLDDVDDAWTTPCYQSVDEVGEERRQDIVCSHCRNHCTACVYDCQRRYDDAEESLSEAVQRGVLEGSERDLYLVCVEDWDRHRPLKQTMVVPCEGERKRVNVRRRGGKRGGMRKARVVLGGESVNDPKWPAVLLTFDRGVSDSFREQYRKETWC